MKRFLAATTFCISCSFCTAQTIPWKAPATADDVKNPCENNPAATEKGKKTFLTICFVCHGEKGKGDGVGAAALNPKPANFTSDKVQGQTDGALFWKMTSGRGQMVSYKAALTDEQRWQLVNYIRILGNKRKT